MILTPIKAIRKHCIFCCGDQIKEVKYCQVKDCSLYPYRMGHRPKTGTEAETDTEEIVAENISE